MSRLPRSSASEFVMSHLGFWPRSQTGPGVSSEPNALGLTFEESRVANHPLRKIVCAAIRGSQYYCVLHNGRLKLQAPIFQCRNPATHFYNRCVVRSQGGNF